jgi:triphosphoribosyl-dephospho-CoA synthetase
MKKDSFFSQFSDAVLFGVICLMIPVLFSLGYYYGLSHSDRAATETSIRNREMRDSIDVYRQKETSLRQESISPAESTATRSSAY